MKQTYTGTRSRIRQNSLPLGFEGLLAKSTTSFRKQVTRGQN